MVNTHAHLQVICFIRAAYKKVISVVVVVVSSESLFTIAFCPLGSVLAWSFWWRYNDSKSYEVGNVLSSELFYITTKCKQKNSGNYPF